MVDMQKIYLKSQEERRIKSGHLWVYSNEIDTKAHALTGFLPGQCVTLVSARDEILGSGYVNPHTLLAVRLYSNRGDVAFDAKLIYQRLVSALSLRQAYFSAPYYRLCFSEGDFLPGVIIDRFNDVLVLQLTTQGAWQAKALIVEVLVDLIKPKGILLKNEQQSLQLEGLTPCTEVLYGVVPDELLIYENDISFYVPLQHGQKTGWFFDQRANRARLKNFVKDKRVLDVFAYLGSFGIYAGVYGASHITFIESSKFACDYIAKNLATHHLEAKADIIISDAFEALKKLKAEGKTFDVVLVDPPAFIKRKKDVSEGFLAYQRINELALACLHDQGFFVSSSCSMHLSASDLVAAVTKANKRRSSLKVIDLAYQDSDHPWHPLIPETQYLKSIFLTKNKY